MDNKMFGEIKARKNIFPSEAGKIVNKGTIDILIIQAKASEETKSILDEGNITLYECVEPDEIDHLREQVTAELETKEKKESE